ncbi:MAG: biopolymer transporter ExbD [Gemmatimonadota bacterium]|nr:biopolymer transporter ExbD [Gemmatimonadota bacterium]
MASPLRREHGLMAEINVTSLVDVTIVLLIMFMIIAPISQGGIEVRVPRAETAPLPSSEAILVSMDEEGKVFVDRTEVRPEAAGEVLEQIRSSRGLSRVYVRADESVAYGRVARLMASIREAGFENVGLVFEPPPGEEGRGR